MATAVQYKYPEVRNYVGGKFVDADVPHLDVFDPSSGDVISRVPLSAARGRWIRPCASRRPPCPPGRRRRSRSASRSSTEYKTLLEKNIDELSALITEENGKIASEARAEVLKSAELCEFACSLPQIAPGEVLEVSRGVECRIERYPLGVVAAITPFNFPNMVPNWSIPNAIALGNCLILKPSELVPLSAGRIAELLSEAGLPEGVLQIVNGGKEAVEAICDHPGIAAVSFVGSTKIAKVVYRRATSNLKRCLALGGAKNHLIVMPDADQEMTSSNVVASMSGCAGQRCMAASVMVAVSKTDHIIAKMVTAAKKMVPGKDIGPVISAESKARITRYIDEAEAAGAKVLVDGRGTKVAGKEGGYYIGPTIIDHVTPDMKIAQEEVLRPRARDRRAPNVDGALAIENASPYGNAASVFTESGGVARYVMEHASAGMVGVNVGRSRAARAVLVRRLERLQVRRRRHHRTRLDRVLDAGEEDDHEVEQGSWNQLDVVAGVVITSARKP